MTASIFTAAKKLNKKPVLEITHLHFDYQDMLFLQGIHWSLSPGELLHLQGANGAGKTTLLRLIAGLYEADAGSIRINGFTLQEDPVAYRKQLCFVSHKTGLNPYLTVQETLIFDLQNRRATENIQQKLAEFNLEHLANTRCAHLSAGQQRRVALLLLTVSEARLWLLDEPLVALDEQSVQLLMTQMSKHRLAGGALVLTSHQSLPKQLGDYKEYAL